MCLLKQTLKQKALMNFVNMNHSMSQGNTGLFLLTFYIVVDFDLEQVNLSIFKFTPVFFYLVVLMDVQLMDLLVQVKK